jgi:uncharacterized protein (TIGR03437 family)
MPTGLDGVTVTLNGKSPYVYDIRPTQVNILTPPDAMPGQVVVRVNYNGVASALYSVSTQPLSLPSSLINGGPYVVPQHSADNSLVGPAGLLEGVTTPAKPGETVVLYANGFGPILHHWWAGRAPKGAAYRRCRW